MGGKELALVLLGQRGLGSGDGILADVRHIPLEMIPNEQRVDL